MTIKDFTKIKFAGNDAILITDRDNQETICILKDYEIDKLNEEWNYK
jgi:hypothetical protein